MFSVQNLVHQCSSVCQHIVMMNNSVWFCHHLDVFNRLTVSDITEYPGGNVG